MFSFGFIGLQLMSLFTPDEVGLGITKCNNGLAAKTVEHPKQTFTANMEGDKIAVSAPEDANPASASASKDDITELPATDGSTQLGADAEAKASASEQSLPPSNTNEVRESESAVPPPAAQEDHALSSSEILQPEEQQATIGGTAEMAESSAAKAAIPLPAVVVQAFAAPRETEDALLPMPQLTTISVAAAPSTAPAEAPPAPPAIVVHAVHVDVEPTSPLSPQHAAKCAIMPRASRLLNASPFLMITVLLAKPVHLGIYSLSDIPFALDYPSCSSPLDPSPASVDILLLLFLVASA